MSRGEKPIEPRYSWFSAKTIEVVSCVFVVGGKALSWFSAKTIEVVSLVFVVGGKALKWLGGVKSYQTISNSEYQRIIARETVHRC